MSKRNLDSFLFSPNIVDFGSINTEIVSQPSSFTSFLVSKISIVLFVK